MTKAEQIYGGSLYELAREEGLADEIFRELSSVVEILDEAPDYWRFLGTLSIPKQERCAALEEAFGGRVQPYLLNFMKLLCENGSIAQLRGCAKEFKRRYHDDHDIVEVCAVTAVTLSAALRERLHTKLQAVLGKTVELTNRIDPACMGGVLLELPGRQLDGTVKHRLDALRGELKAATL
ncbi:MAG: ATP synthase F1 subunit delta [Oscillospiraceae bacterium]|nr:ATP synthase F1 subunit delta [Oscillospiraceae bacterium]